jgi:hypothetical protein
MWPQKDAKGAEQGIGSHEATKIMLKQGAHFVLKAAS